MSEAERPSPKDAQPAAAGANRETTPAYRSAAFRRALLARLPVLEARTFDAGQTLDVYQDVEAINDLDADAFLRPLESSAERDDA